MPKCEKCGVSFGRGEKYEFSPPKLCLECETDSRRSVSTDKQPWESICPKRYRETNDEDDRISECVSISKEWDPESDIGFGLISKSGKGKTRAAFIALKNSYDKGLKCAAISHTRLSNLATSAARDGEGADILVKLKMADVLLIDDLGKGHSTERANQELLDILEERSAEMKPVIWTSNAGSKWLIDRFGEDRGRPIARRLFEFSPPVQVG